MAERFELIGELWADPGGTQHPYAAVLVAAVVEGVYVLQRDGRALHSDYLCDAGHLPTAVGHPGEMNEKMKRRSDLLANRLVGQLNTGHQHHGLESGDGITGAVGVDGRQRTLVAGVHGLEHVERLTATRLPDDYAVGPHTQRVTHEVTNRNLASSFYVGRAGLESDGVPLLQL